PTVPLPTSLLIVGLFWLTTVLNNLAMSFQVSVPLQIVFRCGNVLGSMVVGRLWMKRRYAPAHIGSVLVLTLGVVVFTIATQSTSSHQARDALAESTSEGESLVSFAIGVGLMLASLGVTAVLGTLQERTYQRYATPWTEALFSTHALALPLFWLLRHDIRAKWVEMHALAIRGQAGLAGAAVSRLPGRPMILDLLPPRHASPIPPLWIAMVVNVVTQYVCIAGVAQLNGMLASVHVNMILTVRKFASLVISLVLFHHPITPAHGWGGGLVVLGTLGVIFSQWQQFSYKQSLARATNLVVADPSP
ncbi:UAA transporter, partial [Caulochytrium protostelioides]